MGRQHIWIALGITAVVLIGLSTAILPWWSSGETSMIGMSLDLTGVKVCLGHLCERQWYSELPKQAFAKDPTQFVALGRITLGLGAAGGVAILVQLATMRSASKISPARLAIGFFAVALVLAIAFFFQRPELTGLDPQLGDPSHAQDLGELGDAMAAALVPKLGVGAGFPLFLVGAAAGGAAAVLALRRRP